MVLLKSELSVEAWGLADVLSSRVRVRSVTGLFPVGPLGTATGDHVVTSGHDLARECHICDVGNAERKLRKKYHGEGSRALIFRCVKKDRPRLRMGSARRGGRDGEGLPATVSLVATVLTRLNARGVFRVAESRSFAAMIAVDLVDRAIRAASPRAVTGRV